MTTTPRVGATDWAAAQASPWIAHNEALRRIEAGAGRYPVADRVTAPPGSCADGANYIIIATATGAFAGKEDQIATAVGVNAASGWLYNTLGAIDEGTVAYVQDEDVEYKWSGSAWAVYTGGGVGSTASTTEQLTGTETAKASTPDSVAALWEQGSDVASAGTVSLGEGGYFVITGTTTITDIDFATDKAGRKAWVKFAGSLTLTHNASTLILPTAGNITTAAGDTACFVSEGSDAVRCVSYQRASGAPLVVSGVGTGAWTLIGSNSPSTSAAVTFTGLAGYTDLMVYAAGVACSVSGTILLQCSTNNGSSYYSASGDYLAIDSAGTTVNTVGASFWSTNSTSARYGLVMVRGINVTGAPKMMWAENVTSTMLRPFVADNANDVDAIQLVPSGGGTMSGGTIYLWGR